VALFETGRISSKLLGNGITDRDGIPCRDKLTAWHITAYEGSGAAYSRLTNAAILVLRFQPRCWNSSTRPSLSGFRGDLKIN
jgi:hypothetical protein